MNKIFLLLLLFTCGMTSMSASAQTLAQAKNWYGEGEYEKAKPVFARFVKSYPNNGNYNLWYGVCCLKTGQAAESVSYLEKSVKRRTPSGQLYLGLAYKELYRYEEAIETFEAYIADLKKRKRATAEADSLLAKSRIGLRLLRGVEDVRVIDSFVVDKQTLPEAYRLGSESGKLARYQDYFGTEGQGGTTYENELGSRLYYSKLQPDSTLHIFASNKLLENWSQGRPLPDNLNTMGANADYPYMLSDGLTLYYASDGPESLGGYDIFVTRYNTNSDSYLAPENVGMPFNSPYNDYLYAIDEYNNLGWFASDRYQPEGKVCIYLFIPNTSKQVYDYKTTSHDQLVRLAQLSSLQMTWSTDSQAVAQARTRLQEILSQTQSSQQQAPQRDFEFIIDDEHTYYKLADFHSDQARERYQSYAREVDNYHQQQTKLDALRQQYAKANKAEQQRLSTAILDLEGRVRLLENGLKQAVKEIRQLEKHP